MKQSVAERFFRALERSSLDFSVLTEDMTGWSVTSRRQTPALDYIANVTLLQSFFPQGLRYEVDATVADGNKVVAQAHGSGRLSTGETYENCYVFVFTIRGDRIARIEEYFDRQPIEGLLMPLFAAAWERQC